MFSPSSTTQKNLSEEDSSGSDGGSEVSQEPETDRFGFIVANGSTAGSVGPPPELVRQRETKWINIILQWDRMLLKKTSKIKVQCQKGIPASLRAKCWPLLCAATNRMKQNENLYETLDSEPALQSWVDVIERDLDRQFPFHEMFLSKDGHGQRGLFRVLKAYTQYQPEEGYCQAQGPVAAVLLMNMPAEEAFWCLVQISEQYLPGYYSPLLEGVLFDAGMLTWVLKRTCPAAHKHLQHHGVEPLMFATDWLMCLFTRHLPFNTLLRVWDLFFCYGVRVLLQVAVVLVRRVLGRADQRKECEGQMETLERLRGVREQVQEEDDTFIAEVCSVPLSARDLEKQTKKALEKWRTDRPSSTFDPRGRCLGYQMAWARARRSEEEQDRKEREKGNLSVPLSRSASTLSLSPSLLHRRLRKGGKANNAGEWEGGRKVVRHLSMGAKEDWRSWNELNFKKVEGVKEEEDVEEHKKQSESKPTGQTEEKELLEEPKKTDKVENIVSEQEPVIVEEQTQQDETEITKKEEIQDNKMLSEQTEQTNVGTEANGGPDKDKNDHTSHHQQAEEQDSYSQPQVQEQQSPKGQDEETQDNDSKEETEKQVSESEHSAAVEVQKGTDADTNGDKEIQAGVDSSEGHMIQADTKPEERTESKTEMQTEEGTVAEVSGTRTQTSPDSETDVEVEAAAFTHPDSTAEPETQEEAITVTDKNAEVDAFEVKCQSTESLEETEIKEESHTQTETETEKQVEEKKPTQNELETETGETDSEQHMDPKTETEAGTLIPFSAECIQQEEASGVAAVTEAEAEISVADDTKMESSGAFADCSEREYDTGVSEPSREKKEIISTVHPESDNDQTRAEESSSDTQTNEETADSAAPPEETSKQAEAVNLTTEPERKASPVGIITAEEPPPAEPTPKEPALKGRAPEEPTPEEPTPEDLSPEKPASENLSPEKPASEDLPDEEPASENLSPEEPASESLAPKEPASEEPASEDLPPEEPASEDLAPKEPASEDLPPEETAPEQPTGQLTVGPSEEVENIENVQEDSVGKDDVFISTNMTEEQQNQPQIQNQEDSPVDPNNCGLMQASGRRNSRSSGDFCVRKSSSSRESRLARRLSEDLFTSPLKTSQSQPVPDHPEVKADPAAINLNQTPPGVTQSSKVPLSPSPEVTVAEQEPTAAPKRFGLFRRLRGEQPKKAKDKGAKKMQVPKILIQDFSDGKGMEKVVDEESEDKLSSRERRRRRRERERKEKEEEKLRKKKEKETEKERERDRRKPQTRGKSFQVQKEKSGDKPPQPVKTGSQTRTHSASYAESYF